MKLQINCCLFQPCCKQIGHCPSSLYWFSRHLCPTQWRGTRVCQCPWRIEGLRALTEVPLVTPPYQPRDLNEWPDHKHASYCTMQLPSRAVFPNSCWCSSSSSVFFFSTQNLSWVAKSPNVFSFWNFFQFPLFYKFVLDVYHSLNKKKNQTVTPHFVFILSDSIFVHINASLLKCSDSLEKH